MRYKNHINSMARCLFGGFAAWFFFAFLFVQSAKAQCPTGGCDIITIDTPAFNCYRFSITNDGYTGLTPTKIKMIRFFTDNQHLMQWICSVTTPNDWAGTGSWWGTTDVNFEKWYQDTSPGMTSSIGLCQTKQFTICFCCLENKQAFNYPLTIRTYYYTAGGLLVDSCDHAYNLEVKKTEDCQLWECEEACNELTVEPFFDPTTNEQGFCATISQVTAGELREFSLDIDCISSGQLRDWRVKSMPAGWYNSSISDTSMVFVDTGGVTGGNCDEVTFCFLSNGCGSEIYCDSMRVSLHTNAQVDTCDVSALLVLPKSDTSCCYTAIGVSDPIQDQSTGVWDMCVKVHRSDASSMNTITICVVSDRCIELESTASGWTLTSISPPGCYNFTRTTAPNTGCRTFEFCFKTCDCLDLAKPVTFTVSGQNLTTTPVQKTIPRDAGTCCNGVWHKRDHVTVTQTSSNCLTFTLLNSRYPCTSALNDFHFDISGIPCQVTSITVPPGYAAQQIGNVIHVTPAAINGDSIDCCESMSVVVCFNCSGTFGPFSSHWWSTYNGTTITDTTQTFLGGPVAPPLKVTNTGETRLQGEQNYPNPFGSTSQFKTTIPFTTDGTGTAEITVVDATGKVILTDDLVITDAGKHFFYFTGEQLPAGTYYYKIEFPKDERVIVQRAMILVK